MAVIKLPALRFHKPSKQFYAWQGNRRIYFGEKHADAVERYHRFIATIIVPADQSTSATATAASAKSSLTVAEAVLLYYKHKQKELEDGRIRRYTLDRVRAATRAVAEACGEMPVCEFRGKALEKVQQYLVKRRLRRKVRGNRKRPPRFDPNATLSRQYANLVLSSVMLCWSWLVKEEIVPPDNLAIMREVAPIGEQPGVRESTRITPVSVDVVEATLPECHPTLTAMIRLQQLTGMRPGEICAMRRCDLSTLPSERIKLPKSNYEVSAREHNGQRIWLYAPGTHKTLRKRKVRVILIGPRAQEILYPYLNREPQAHIFNPNEAVQLYRKLQRERRQSPVQPSQVERAKRNRAKGGKVSEREYYTSESYGRAVARAIDRTNAARVAKGIEPIPTWAPNQLRHAVATEVAERFDEATAAALIGHSGMDTIKVYAEQAIGKAAAAAAEMG